MKRTVRRTTTERVEQVITAEELRQILLLPVGTKLTIDVPSGGDYSGCTLGVDEVGGITAIYTITTESGK